MLTRRSLLAAPLLGVVSTGAKARRYGPIPVDLVLVLAVDVSRSVTPDRWHVQREGYVQAFRSREVRNAIVSGPVGSIAVTLVEWSSPGQQRQVGGWHVIHDDESAYGFSAQVATMGRYFSGSTAIGAALLRCNDFIRRAPFVATRKVIDISGDGKHTEETFVEMEEGPPLSYARRTVVGNNVVINGLPIIGARDTTELPEYYEHNVIGGQGAFIEVVENPDDVGNFTRALTKKLVREIA